MTKSPKALSFCSLTSVICPLTSGLCLLLGDRSDAFLQRNDAGKPDRVSGSGKTGG